MRIIAPLAAWLTLGLSVTAAAATAILSIDQGPIVRVLRLSDVPGARDAGEPSGALNASQFALNNDSTRAARRAEIHLLTSAGFKSSALSELGNSGRLLLKSGAIELGSSALAAKALREEAALSAHTQAPSNTIVTSTADHNLPSGILLTFRPTAKGDLGGLELLTRAGSYVYTLAGTDQPDHISRATLEGLLKTVMSRS